MKKLRRLTTKAILGSSGGAFVVLAAAVFIWPPLAHYEAANLVTRASDTTVQNAQVDFHLANLLDAHNVQAAIHLAQAYLAASNPAAANSVLTRAGKGRSLLDARIATDLELGDYVAADHIADQLSQSTLTVTQVTLIAYAHQLAGQGTKLISLEASVSSPEALQRIKIAETVNIALASSMAASGLPISSSVILANLPDSPPKQLLLATIAANRAMATDWADADRHFQNYLLSMPTDINARNNYKILLTKLGRQRDAATQDRLISSLKTGQP
jgi:hypothetical protein